MRRRKILRYAGAAPLLIPVASLGQTPSLQYDTFVDAGGLISLGGHINESYRIAGTYAGRILKGEKPENLAVQQVTKVELVFNLRTSKAMGLAIPERLKESADRVVE